MNKAEKSYFKRFSKQHLIGKKKRYVTLFDLIQDQEDYDEIKILEKIKNPSFVKNFAEHKRYLYQQVLKALRNYESQRSVYIQLRKTLMNIELLYKREMYESALKLIDESLEIAFKYELYNISLSLYAYQIKISFDREDCNYWGNYLTELHNTQNNVLKALHSLKMHGYIQLKVTHDLMVRGEREGYSIDLEKYPIDGFRVALIYYNSQAARSVDSGDVLSTYEYRKKIHCGFLRQPHFIVDCMYIYTTNFFRYISCCEELGKAEEGVAATKQVNEQIALLYAEEAITNEQYSEAIALIYAANILLNVKLRDVKALEENYSLIKTKNLVQENKGVYTIYRRLLYVNVIAELLLDLKDAALDSIYEFNSHKHIKGFTRDEAIMRMLTILVHYEHDNAFLLPNLIDSTYSFLRSKNLLGDFEKLFLSFFKNKILKIHPQSKQALKVEFIAFKEAVEVLDAKKLESGMLLKRFDLGLWAESKVRGCSMRTLLEMSQE